MRTCLRYCAALFLLAAPPACTGPDASPLLLIRPGPDAQQRLQEALILARPGTTVALSAGQFDFSATVSLDVPGVTLRGAGQDQTVLSFRSQQAGTGGEGLLVTADRFVLEDLAIVDTPGDAVKVNGAQHVVLRRVRVDWTDGPQTSNGAYGLYPVLCRDVLIEHCLVRGASDAGIYVGQSENIVIRHNEVTQNVAGIEIENSVAADVHDNMAGNNTAGILVFTLPDLVRKQGAHCRVFNNSLLANNHPNFADPGGIVAIVPPGSGLIVMANDHVEVFANRFADNQTMNVAVVSYLATQRPLSDPEYDPYCEAIHIHHNHFHGGGDRPAGPLGLLLSLLAGGKLPAIVYDGAVDPGKLVDGRLPPELGLYLNNNFGQAGFINLDLAGIDLSVPYLPRPGRISRDPAPHTGSLPPLAAVRLEFAP